MKKYKPLFENWMGDAQNYSFKTFSIFANPKVSELKEISSWSTMGLARGLVTDKSIFIFDIELLHDDAIPFLIEEGVNIKNSIHIFIGKDDKQIGVETEGNSNRLQTVENNKWVRRHLPNYNIMEEVN